MENFEQLILKISIGEGLEPKEKDAVLGYSGMTTSCVMLIKSPLVCYISPSVFGRGHEYNLCKCSLQFPGWILNIPNI